MSAAQPITSARPTSVPTMPVRPVALSTSMARLLPLALKRAPGLPEGAHLPALEERMRVQVDAGWLGAYRALVGAVDDGALPSCAPQVLAAPLHLRLLGHQSYPLPVLGMVHIRNVIDETQPVPASAALLLRAAVAGERHTPRGIEVDIVTEARTDADARPLWTSTMTALVRTASAEGGRKKDGPDARGQGKPGAHDDTAPRALLSSSVVRVGADLGRRYARVAGDANPIHLTSWTAKAFGFPRAIAHGMWTLQRALCEVADGVPAAPRRIEARFIKPVLLPGAFVVEQERVHDAAHASVVVRPMKSGAPHVLVDVRGLEVAMG